MLQNQLLITDWRDTMEPFLLMARLAQAKPTLFKVQTLKILKAGMNSRRVLALCQEPLLIYLAEFAKKKKMMTGSF